MTNEKNREALKAAEVLRKHLKSLTKGLTIADASAKSGLPLRDAELGLHFLVSEYRGHLSATESGELLFHFPHGFNKPWEKIERLQAIWNKTKKAGLGVAKFVVRAWISVVLVGYVAIFALILLAMTFGRNSDREDNSSFGGTLLFHTLFRVILDSLFWTFHPFSPFNVGYNADPYGRPRKKDVPFYEKVNRFFFGPEPKPVDPLEQKRLILAEIRAKKGRIGIFDVMRVTGLPRKDADPLMATLMLDYDGEVNVSNEGGIYYEFPEIRKTVQSQESYQPSPIWNRRENVPPLTGNPASSNLLITALNGFNLLMSFVAITNGWTIERLQYLFSMQARLGIPPPPADMPILLGLIPCAFSIALFMLPLTRAAFYGRKKQKIEQENGRRGLLHAIITKLSRDGIDERSLAADWQAMSGAKPSDKQLISEIVKLGGELEVDENGKARYRFRDLEAEMMALERERKLAKDSELHVGDVVFSSAR